MDLKRWSGLVAVVVLVAACGGTDVTSDKVVSIEDAQTVPTTAAAAEVDTEQALLDLAQCLRDHGIEVTDPTVDANGNFVPPRPVEGQQSDREAFRVAREECAEFLEGVTLGFRDFDFTALEDTLLEFAQCMRDNGYEMDDPDFSSFGQPPGAGGGPGAGIFGPGGIDPTDPDFIAAQEVCEDILAGLSGRFGGGFRGGGG